MLSTQYLSTQLSQRAREDEKERLTTAIFIRYAALRDAVMEDFSQSEGQTVFSKENSLLHFIRTEIKRGIAASKHFIETNELTWTAVHNILTPFKEKLSEMGIDIDLISTMTEDVINQYLLDSTEIVTQRRTAVLEMDKAAHLDAIKRQYQAIFGQDSNSASSKPLDFQKYYVKVVAEEDIFIVFLSLIVDMNCVEILRLTLEKHPTFIHMVLDEGDGDEQNIGLLHIASRKLAHKTVQLLLTTPGVDVNVFSRNQLTPLGAAMNGLLGKPEEAENAKHILTSLIAAGADPRIGTCYRHDLDVLMGLPPETPHQRCQNILEKMDDINQALEGRHAEIKSDKPLEAFKAAFYECIRVITDHVNTLEKQPITATEIFERIYQPSPFTLGLGNKDR